MKSAAGESRWEPRRKAREAAVEMLYQAEIGNVEIAEASRRHGSIIDRPGHALDDEARAYAEALAGGTWEARGQLDERIGESAKNWRVERLAVLDRIVLRLAIQELLVHPDTPPRVVIDEAIELARAYSGEEAARFVNGVLDAVYRRLKDEGRVIDDRI
jgi:N utilization substance protein B